MSQAAASKAPTLPLGLSPRDATFPLYPGMIERRRWLAVVCGYVVRNPCSFVDPNAPTSAPTFDCLESVALDSSHEGHPCAREHAVCDPIPGNIMYWPDAVTAAAWAIDKGKPLAGDRSPVPPPAQQTLPLAAVADMGHQLAPRTVRTKSGR